MSWLIRAIATMGTLAVVSGITCFLLISILGSQLTGLPAEAIRETAIAAGIAAAFIGAAIDNAVGISQYIFSKFWEREKQEAARLYREGYLNYRQALIKSINASYYLISPANPLRRISNKDAKRIRTNQLWVVRHILPLINSEVGVNTLDPGRNLDRLLDIVDELSDAFNVRKDGFTFLDSIKLKLSANSLTARELKDKWLESRRSEETRASYAHLIETDLSLHPNERPEDDDTSDELSSEL